MPFQEEGLRYHALAQPLSRSSTNRNGTCLAKKTKERMERKKRHRKFTRSVNIPVATRDTKARPGASVTEVFLSSEGEHCGENRRPSYARSMMHTDKLHNSYTTPTHRILFYDQLNMTVPTNWTYAAFPLRG